MKLYFFFLRHIVFPIILLITIISTTCTNKPQTIEHGIFAASRLESVVGQDGVCSIKFSDDITLWTFADTITGRWKSEKGRVTGDKNEAVMNGMLSNSMAWSKTITENNYSDIRLEFYKENGKVSQFIKNKKNENPVRHRFWALDGFRTGNKVYVYYLHVYIPDSRKFLEFEVLSVGLARWDIPAGWKPGDKMNFIRIDDLFSKATPFFGAAVMERDGFVYLAGHFKKSNTEFPISVARVKTEDVENRKAYSFLASDGKWTNDIKIAGNFIGDISGECSLSYNDYLKHYVIVYSKIFSGDVAIVQFEKFSALPNTSAEIIHRVKKTDSFKMWPYSAKEIFSSGKSIFFIYIDPVKYQPILVELKY